jgi:hypothetical protein
MTMARVVPLLLAALAACLLSLAPCVGQQPAPKLVLLNVSKGQIPPDTGMDDKTKMEIVDNFKDLGGGKALKVPFAPGDSFGSKGSGDTNWKRFAVLRFDAFNPGKDAVALELNVLHARTTSFQTRAQQPIKLKPGKNEVKIGIDELVNVNGSAPDLSRVTKWYINDTAAKRRMSPFAPFVRETTCCCCWVRLAR